ncbi:MAG: hypothetical protein E7329_01370 [Clostridiales bacterium]|nr:hypothetical protein [Clostridiales bacterium]
MYTEQDFTDIRAQLNKRLLLTAIPTVILLAGIIVSFIFRIKLLTMALSLILGAGLIFAYSMLIYPVYAYKRHLNNVLHGKTRTLTGAFKEMEEGDVIREGVHYYPMLLNVGDMKSPEDDRLFYFDANLPKPDWQVGEKLTIISHDKAVGAWERA